MLLHKLRLENLLSFRKAEVELRALNVLIGANASGKSNLIEAIGLLQALPVDLSTAILRLGGVHVVASLAVTSPVVSLECDLHPLCYRLEFAEESRGLVVMREHLKRALANGNRTYFDRQTGRVAFEESSGDISRSQSVFQAYKSPADVTPTTGIGRMFEAILIYREFRTTGDSQVRLGASTSMRKESLHDGGGNLV